MGQKLHFVVRPDKDAWLLLNVDSTGKVSVLYPYASSEVTLLKAATTRAIPGEQPRDQIEVQEPIGMDIQLMFTLPTPKQWHGRSYRKQPDWRLPVLRRLNPPFGFRQLYATKLM